jgi:K+/H+ antiporter YhaU regulatory subunit KhtT
MTKKAKIKTPKIQGLVLIATFSDQKCRQLLINERMQETILNLIASIDGEISVLDKVIEGIEIVKSNQTS